MAAPGEHPALILRTQALVRFSPILVLPAGVNLADSPIVRPRFWNSRREPAAANGARDHLPAPAKRRRKAED